jgi:hypothetical protein
VCIIRRVRTIWKGEEEEEDESTCKKTTERSDYTYI